MQAPTAAFRAAHQSQHGIPLSVAWLSAVCAQLDSVDPVSLVRTNTALSIANPILQFCRYRRFSCRRFFWSHRISPSTLQLFRRSQVVENLSTAAYLESIIPLAGAPVRVDARGYRHYRRLHSTLPGSTCTFSAALRVTWERSANVRRLKTKPSSLRFAVVEALYLTP